MKTIPKITFNVIAFNALSTMPKGMLDALLEWMFPIAHKIIVSEGATKAKTHPFDGDTSELTEHGRSTDGTLEYFKDAVKDPRTTEENYSLIYAASQYNEPTFWDGKTEMFNAMLMSTPEDTEYIWQVDCDEFYHETDIQYIIELLNERKPDVMHFFANHFFGDFDHIVSRDTDHFWGNDLPLGWTRIFKYQPGCKWASHEPPNLLAPNGESLLNSKNAISKFETRAHGIFLYHYSCVVQSQADFKTKFFKSYDYSDLFRRWQTDHEVPLIKGAFTERFRGDHPAVIKKHCLKINE